MYNDYDDHDEGPSTWDGPTDMDIHRGIGVNLPDSLHLMIHNPSIPARLRAEALHHHAMNHGGGLGIHWSTDPSVGEDFAEDSARGYTSENREDSGGDGHPAFGMVSQGRDYPVYQPPPKPASKQGTAVVFHAGPPGIGNIDPNQPDGAYGYHEHSEREVPLYDGNSADVKGIAWKRMHNHDDLDENEEYTRWPSFKPEQEPLFYQQQHFDRSAPGGVRNQWHNGRNGWPL